MEKPAKLTGSSKPAGDLKMVEAVGSASNFDGVINSLIVEGERIGKKISLRQKVDLLSAREKESVVRLCALLAPAPI